MDLIFQYPGFLFGLGLGLLAAFFAWRDGFSKRGELRRELRDVRKELREHTESLGRHLKLNQRGFSAAGEDVEQLRARQHNLRDTLAHYKFKPTAEERHQLEVMDHAIRRLNEQVPGFAAGWEVAYRDAAAEIDRAEKGEIRLPETAVSVRAALPPYDPSGETQRLEARQ